MSDSDLLRVKDMATVGRSAKNDITLRHASVSSTHARLVRQGGRWVVEDLGSKNGTFLNDDARPVRRAELKPTDVVRFGQYRMTASDLVQRVESRLAELASRSSDRAFQGTTYTVGRHKSNNVSIDFPHVSRLHANLLRAEDGRWFIEDKGSSYGTFVNDRRRPVRGRQRIKPTDTVYLGSYKIAASRIMDKAMAREEAARVTLAPDRPLTLGRDPEADVCLDYPQVSWKHARLTPGDGETWLLEDLGSRNGTYVNGERVTKAWVSGRDAISLGSYVLHITADNKIVAHDFFGDIRMDAEGLTLFMGGQGQARSVLDDITFTVYPSEFVGLMGLSGAGKTTLFLTLMGYLRPTAGRTCINGLDLQGHYDQFRGSIGYVPQEDIIHKDLTVREALTFAARLRLPPDVSGAEVDERIRQVLSRLGLYDPGRGLDLRDMAIAPAGGKGISGGERKRVSLAMELLTEPAILFLDEPTSGLSSVDAHKVMALLQELSREGKTVIMTLHQPDLESFKQLDNVLVLDEGKLVYYGPAWPDSLTFFNPERPTDEITGRPESGLVGMSASGLGSEGWETRYRNSEYKRQYVDERREDRQFIDDAGDEEGRRLSRGFFSVRQYATLCARNCTLKIRDSWNSLFLFLQAPVIALLIGLVFHGLDAMQPVALYLLSLSALWLGTNNAACEVVAEKHIFQRERMIGLGIPEYVLAKFTVGLVCGLAQCLLLTLVVLLFVEVRAPWFTVLGVVAGTALVGTALGLLVSSLVRTQAAAQTLVPLLIIPMFLLGGGLVPLAAMDVPGMRAVSMVMPSRWSYEALVNLESPLWEDPAEAENSSRLMARLRDPQAMERVAATLKERFPNMNPDALVAGLERFAGRHGLSLRDRTFGPFATPLWLDGAVMACFVVVFLAGAVLAIRHKDPI